MVNFILAMGAFQLFMTGLALNLCQKRMNTLSQRIDDLARRRCHMPLGNLN